MEQNPTPQDTNHHHASDSCIHANQILPDQIAWIPGTGTLGDNVYIQTETSRRKKTIVGVKKGWILIK